MTLYRSKALVMIFLLIASPVTFIVCRYSYVVAWPLLVIHDHIIKAIKILILESCNSQNILNFYYK